ncbi:MAG TPA: GNAT family N-acetyltransferase [Cyclobacteriaceae bacterium]|jgi:GNAT superfamily N-acetyltransferase
MNIKIEEADERHISSIADLSTELGYPITRAKVTQNMNIIKEKPDHKVWVAKEGEQVLGWCHAAKTCWVMMESMIEVFGLVVSAKSRGKGIGKMLINRVELFARENGVAEVWIRSNRKRRESHPFYLNLAYTNLKDQAVYVKKV